MNEQSHAGPAPESRRVPAPPAAVGMPVGDVDTPALLVELDEFERNLDCMSAAARKAGVRLRPHAKTHKCANIALAQVARGAVGVCCQKVSEAEALVGAGVDDVLVSNQVVGRMKVERLAALARRARVGVCVDDASNVAALSAAARAAGSELEVLVEIDVGAARCGVPPGAAAVALAKTVDAAPALRFGGLQAYQGSAQHLRSPEARRGAIEAAAAGARATVALLTEAGLDCLTIAGAGTGTYAFEAASGVYNELQVGSYVFMDADYARNVDESGQPIKSFEHSLFVLTTVMSAPAAGRVIVDAGLKALSVDSGLPLVHGASGLEYVSASDEHGKLSVAQGVRAPVLEDKLRLIPGHCDPTVNLYDWIVAVRGGEVEAVWPVVARGALY